MGEQIRSLDDIVGRGDYRVAGFELCEDSLEGSLPNNAVEFCRGGSVGVGPLRGSLDVRQSGERSPLRRGE